VRKLGEAIFRRRVERPKSESRKTNFQFVSTVQKNDRNLQSVFRSAKIKRSDFLPVKQISNLFPQAQKTDRNLQSVFRSAKIRRSDFSQKSGASQIRTGHGITTGTEKKSRQE